MTRRRARAIARCARTAGLWSASSLVLGALLAATAPLAIGDRSYIVRSGSMTPAIDTGDIVVTEPIAPLEAQVGDIVTFLDPSGSGRLLSHRVWAVHRSTRRVEFVTQGDANTSQERWTVPVDGRIGRVVYRLPTLGYALSWTGSPAGRIAAIAAPALLLCWCILARIWRPARIRTTGNESPN